MIVLEPLGVQALLVSLCAGTPELDPPESHTYYEGKFLFLFLFFHLVHNIL